jgi:hypothetical protein
MAEKKQLISRVIGAYRVRDDENGGEYVLAWGINNTSFERTWLEPRENDPCSFDFRVVPGPLDVLTPAAAIARLSEDTICEWIYVHGENGEVRAVQGVMPTK